MICYYCGNKYSYDHPLRCRKRKVFLKTAFARLKFLCENLDLPINNGDSLVWNGTNLEIPNNSGPEYHLLSLAHEIAHWILADPDDRKFRDFNLRDPINDVPHERYVFVLEQTILLTLGFR